MFPVQVVSILALGLTLLVQADNKVQTITINSPTSGAALNPLNAAVNTYLQSRNQGNGPPYGAGAYGGGFVGPLYGGQYGAYSGPYGAFGGPYGAYDGQGGSPYGTYGGQGGNPYGAYGGRMGVYGQGGAYGPNYGAPYGAGVQFGYPGYPGSYTVRPAGNPASEAYYPGQVYGSNHGAVPGYGGLLRSPLSLSGYGLTGYDKVNVGGKKR